MAHNGSMMNTNNSAIGSFFSAI